MKKESWFKITAVDELIGKSAIIFAIVFSIIMFFEFINALLKV